MATDHHGQQIYLLITDNKGGNITATHTLSNDSAIRQSQLFNDILSCINGPNKVYFPPQFNSVVNYYLDYCDYSHCYNDNGHDGQETMDNDQLAKLLQLADFLDDEQLLQRLMQDHVRPNYSRYQVMLEGLSAELHSRMKMYLPLCLLNYTEADYVQHSPRLKTWLARNLDKVIIVDGQNYVTVLTPPTPLRPLEGDDPRQPELIKGRQFYCYKNTLTKHGPFWSWNITDNNGDDYGHNETIVTSAIGNYYEDKQHGVWKYYYSSGAQKQETNFINGIKHGLQRYWFADSQQLKLEENFHMGKLHGLTTKFKYTNSKCHYKCTEIQYFDGKVASEKHYKSNGRIRRYMQNNIAGPLNASKSIYEIRSYHTGTNYMGIVFQGNYQHTSSLPDRKDRIRYRNNEELEISYYSCGTKCSTTAKGYPDELNGDSWRWYKSGQAKSRCAYKTNLLHGRSYGWYRSGQLKYVCSHRQGQRHGLWLQLTANGRVKSRHYYCDDVRLPSARAAAVFNTLSNTDVAKLMASPHDPQRRINITDVNPLVNLTDADVGNQ